MIKTTLYCVAAFAATLTQTAYASSAYACSPFAYGPASWTTTPTGINNKQQVVGYSTDDSRIAHGFLREPDGSIATIAHPNAAATDSTFPVAINNLGQTLGYYTEAGENYAFIRNADGSYMDIDPPQPPSGQAYSDFLVSGINDKGEIAGTFIADPNILLLEFFIRAPDGTYRIVNRNVGHAHGPEKAGPLNNSDVLLEIWGTVFDSQLQGPDGKITFLYYPGFTSGNFGRTHGLNNHGATVGGDGYALLHTADNHYQAVACPDSLDTYMTATALNDDNVVVGTLAQGSSWSAFIATPTGLKPQLELSNTSWSFASHAVGVSNASGRIYVSNPGQVDAYIQNVYVAGMSPDSSPPAFSITRTNCASAIAGGVYPLGPVRLPAGSWCSIDFNFTPRVQGWQKASIYIIDDSPNSPQVIPIGGTGIGSSLQLSNTSWTFAAHPIGEPSGNGVIYAHNGGGGPIAFQSLYIGGTNNADFSIVQNTCGSSLAPYATCAVTFRFTPLATGLRSANLEMFTNSQQGDLQIPLFGVGK